jgi:hypothetical protein
MRLLGRRSPMIWFAALKLSVQSSFLAILPKSPLVVADILRQYFIIRTDRTGYRSMEVTHMFNASWIDIPAGQDVVIEPPWYSRRFAVVQLRPKLADQFGDLGGRLLHE